MIDEPINIDYIESISIFGMDEVEVGKKYETGNDKKFTLTTLDIDSDRQYFSTYVRLFDALCPNWYYTGSFKRFFAKVKVCGNICDDYENEELGIVLTDSLEVIEFLNGHYESNESHFYFKDGLLHREDGPAYKLRDDGEEHWCIDGLYHRIDGPAITTIESGSYWYIDGKRIEPIDYQF